MPIYTPQTWHDLPATDTPLSAARLAVMEAGIAAASPQGGVFNVKDGGAKGNNSTDDTAAIQATITAAQTAGGGTVYFPEGTYLVTPTSSPALSNTASSVTLVGAGKNASLIKKTANGISLSFHGSGPGDSNHVKYGGIQNLGFLGNDKSGPILRLYYAGEMAFDHVRMFGNQDVTVDCVELWDSRFYDCSWDWCGIVSGPTYSPNVLLRNSAAPSGFGFSTDNCNQVHFIGCRWESFSNGALGVVQGVANSDSPNGIYIVNGKMESNQLVAGPILQFGDGSVHCQARGLYVYAGDFKAGFSTPINAIAFTGTQCSLEDTFIANGGVNTLNVGVDAWNSQNSVLQNVIGQYVTAPSSGNHVYLESNVTNLHVRHVRTNVGNAVVDGSSSAGSKIIDDAPGTVTNKILIDPKTTNITPTAGYTYDVGTPALPYNNLWAGFAVNIQNAGVNTQINAGANASNKTLTLPLGNDTLVGRNSVDILTQKTLDDTNSVSVKAANFRVEDDTDPTKKVAFNVAGVAAGQTRTLTVPNTNGSLSLTQQAETFAGTKTFVGYTESVVPIGNTGTAKTISLTNGTIQTATLTGNCVFTMPAVGAGKSFMTYLSTGAGGFTATFTGVKWPGGIAPVITTAAAKMDILSFVSDGTSWFGSFAQGY